MPSAAATLVPAISISHALSSCNSGARCGCGGDCRCRVGARRRLCPCRGCRCQIHQRAEAGMWQHLLVLRRRQLLLPRGCVGRRSRSGTASAAATVGEDVVVLITTICNAMDGWTRPARSSRCRRGRGCCHLRHQQRSQSQRSQSRRHHSLFSSIDAACRIGRGSSRVQANVIIVPKVSRHCMARSKHQHE